MVTRLYHGVILFAIILVIGAACGEDNPVYIYNHDEGCLTNGDLEVFTMLNDTAMGAYIAGNVELYLSAEDRLTGTGLYQAGAISASDPSVQGAEFYGITARMYYVKGTFEYPIGSGDIYTGNGEIYATLCSSIVLRVACSL